ncbi:uncharacterized protein PAC_18403 [Phialocephala subalpina]|uniref:Cation efflux protein cytoplasmic domain-containing protein n=1 Tax=Phialocephala subalpina TaxID=576137 RepID=A0A1L7XTZ7_9HELO|nr:uncharacterized protein PAC_18403 [Phialocephala subalpina]
MESRCACLDGHRDIEHAAARCDRACSVRFSSSYSPQIFQELKTNNLSMEKIDLAPTANLSLVSLECAESSDYESSPPPTPQRGDFRAISDLEEDNEDDIGLKSPDVTADASLFIPQNSSSSHTSVVDQQPNTSNTSPQHTARPASKPKYSRVKKYYNRQNVLLDAFLGNDDKERLEIEDTFRDAGRAKLAIHASFGCDLCLVFVYLYASTSTGSLSLQAITAASFVNLVCSAVMLCTYQLSSESGTQRSPIVRLFNFICLLIGLCFGPVLIYAYQARKRIEAVGIILFCGLISALTWQIFVDSVRTLGGSDMMPGNLTVVPFVFVGFGRYRLHVYVTIIMLETEQLKVTRNITQTLQMKLEGIEEVAKATVHVDYDEMDGMLPEHSTWYGVEDDELEEPAMKKTQDRPRKSLMEIFYSRE